MDSKEMISEAKLELENIDMVICLLYTSPSPRD